MQKSLSSQVIVDRFRLLLKQRDDELRVSLDEEVPPPTAGEIVRMYDLLLSELTFNSKNIITDLTIVAEEQIVHGDGIADLICARIIEVPVDQKLPSLYLLDSIVKNVGKDYIHYFSSRLPEVFCEAYRQVHPSMHRSMRHLFETWSTVFPHSVLRRIEAQLQFTPHVNNEPTGLRASESPRPAHGIHVNPKYIRQLEGPNVNSNVNHPSSTPSSLKFCGQKSADGYDEYGSENTEVVPSRVGSKLSSGNVGHLSYAVGSGMPHPLPSARLARPSSSPSRFVTEKPYSPEVEEFSMDNSPGRLERVLPSPVPDFSFRKSIERDVQMNEWQRKTYHDNKRARFEASAAYDLSSGDRRERTRALINAYGNDRGQAGSNEPLNVEYADINGIGGKVAPMSWQNTEEEEFDWDKMGPSSHMRGRSHNLLGPSIHPPRGVGSRPSYIFNGTHSDSNGRRSSISGLSARVDSSTLTRDAVPSLHPRHGSVDKIPGFQASNILGFNSREDVSRLPRPMCYSSQLSIANGARDSQVPPSIGDIPLTAGSRIGSDINSSAREARLPALPSSAGIWSAVNVHRSFPPPMNHMPPLHMQPKFDSLSTSGTFLNSDENNPMSLPMQQKLNTFESKESGSVRLSHFPNLNQPNQAHFTPFSSQFARNQPFPHPMTASLPSHLSVQPSNQLYNQQSSTAAGTVVPSLAPVLPLTVHNNLSSPFLVQRGTLPPMPRGPSPTSSHMIPMPHNPIVSSQPPGSEFSGLISSLMCQGLISLTKETPVKDSIGLEFNADLLKVRHESAISALYSDLPRQCTTCGLRFKCQEEHSSHMDWHVTKNRMSKNRKQKPSRKWFVNTSMWLSGAEALGTDAVPGFLPTENIVEKKDDEDFAVPADDEQKTCALCGEPFDDFYSDETEEWMYKGAVYLSAPSGSADMDRSQLGPIVHAKCRSESNVVPVEGSG